MKKGLILVDKRKLDENNITAEEFSEHWSNDSDEDFRAWTEKKGFALESSNPKIDNPLVMRQLNIFA